MEGRIKIMDCKGCKGIDYYILANAVMKSKEYEKCADCSKVHWPEKNQSKNRSHGATVGIK
jgi:hypothetical protein